MTTPAPLMAELMIGNYLNYTDEPNALYCEVNEICPAGAVIFPVYKSDLGDTVVVTSDKLQPIPITEQWLKEFGFVELIQKTGYNTTEMVIYKPNEDSNYWRFIYNKWTVKIDYVHQLQNLYFALTATKLERGGV